MERVRIGGLFLDIGKIGVPDAILRKPSRLTDEEYCVIKDILKGETAFGFAFIV